MQIGCESREWKLQEIEYEKYRIKAILRNELLTRADRQVLEDQLATYEEMSSES